MKPGKSEDFTKGELQEIMQGIKLTEEAEKTLRVLLKYVDRIGRYPKNFEPDHVELIQDLIVF